MSTLTEKQKQLNLSNAYLAGKKIFGVKFRHHSHVRFLDTDGNKPERWIVSVGPIEPEPIYTVERADGAGDREVLESAIELIFDPHEKI